MAEATSFLPWLSTFDVRSVQMGFVTNSLVLAQVFLRVLGISLLFIIPSMSHSHSSSRTGTMCPSMAAVSWTQPCPIPKTENETNSTCTIKNVKFWHFCSVYLSCSFFITLPHALYISIAQQKQGSWPWISHKRPQATRPQLATRLQLCTTKPHP